MDKSSIRERIDEKGREITGLFEELIEKAKKHAVNVKGFSYPKSLVHTDPVPSNFILGEKISLIDWQRPIISYPAFDVWAFLSKPYNLWDLSETLTNEQKELFLKKYLELRYDPTLVERIKQKEPLYLLQLGLYCLIRYSDYKSGKIAEDVLKGRGANFERYGRTKEVILNRLMEIFE